MSTLTLDKNDNKMLTTILEQNNTNSDDEIIQVPTRTYSFVQSSLQYRNNVFNTPISTYLPLDFYDTYDNISSIPNSAFLSSPLPSHSSKMMDNDLVGPDDLYYFDAVEDLEDPDPDYKFPWLVLHSSTFLSLLYI